MRNTTRNLFLIYLFACANSALADNDAGPQKKMMPSIANSGKVCIPKVVDSSKYVTQQITVSGVVKHKLKLGVDDLKGFPQQQIGEVQVICQSGADMGKLENLKGVLLKDILEKASIVSKNHNDVKNMAIIAKASDGYKVVFSWTEVFNSPIGEGVIVYFEKDGKALEDDEGRIAMVSTKDIRTGPRHVKWLQSIEVRKIAE